MGAAGWVNFNCALDTRSADGVRAAALPLPVPVADALRVAFLCTFGFSTLRDVELNRAGF